MVDVLQFFQGAPTLVLASPIETGGQPHRERLGEVLVGMGLRVVVVEMHHVAPAVRARVVVDDVVGLGERTEQLAPPGLAVELIGVIERMAGLVPEELHAGLLCASLHFEHHGLLELL